MITSRDKLDIQEIIANEIYDDRSGYNNLLKANILFDVYFVIAVSDNIQIKNDVYLLYDELQKEGIIKKIKEEYFTEYNDLWLKITEYLKELEKRNIKMIAIMGNKVEND